MCYLFILMIKISDFLIHINENSKIDFYIKKFNSKFSKIKTTNEFFMGYMSANKKKVGEYLLIKKNKKNITIFNDKFGTYPVYYIKDKNKTFISNSIKLINDRLNNITIDKNQIYEYFCWGYLPCSNKTIYNNVYSLSPGDIVKITNNKIKILNMKKNIFHKKNNLKVSPSNFLKLFISEIKKIGYILKKRESYIGLTAGNDSLLGSLLLSKTDFKFITTTFGDINSYEVTKANYRSKKIFNIKNIKINSKKIFPNKQEIIKLSNLLDGLSTIACFPQFKFHNLINKKYKKKIFLDFSLFEFMRKKIKNKNDLIDKYTTPKQVINNYFKDKFNYYKILKESINRMKNKYGKNFLSYFYLYDRAVKNQFYKAVFLNNQNMTKIALMHNVNILNYNYNYLKSEKKFPFWAVYKKISFLEKFKNEEKLELMKKKNKVYPFDYRKFCLKNKKFFIEVLSNETKCEIGEFFKLNKIISNLKKNYIPKQHEWFYLRLLNLLIFKKENNLQLK